MLLQKVSPLWGNTTRPSAEILKLSMWFPLTTYAQNNLILTFYAEVRALRASLPLLNFFKKGGYSSSIFLTMRLCATHFF